MSLVYLKNKKNGVTYVYESSGYWDKDKKQARNRRVCIGKLDPDTGKLIPSKRQQALEPPATAKPGPVPTLEWKRGFCGATSLFDAIGDKLGISEDLKRCFPDTYRQILSIAYYLILEDRNPLSRFPKWAATHTHPFGKDIPSQRSSELFGSITENAKQNFFQLQARRRLEEEYLAYDTTSISSYSKSLKQVKYGMNKDHDPLPQINLALIFGETSRLPVCFRKLPGNISDVKTISNMLAEIDFLELGKVKLIMDRGFYSEENINELYQKRYKFLIATKTSLKYVKKRLDEIRGTMVSRKHYSSKYGIYYDSILMDWDYSEMKPRSGEVVKGTRRMYLHVYYNDQKATDDKVSFNRMLDSLEAELASGKRIPEHEKSYAKYYEIKQTPVRGITFTPKQDAIDEAEKNYGYFALISNGVKDPLDALEVYRSKDMIEKAFGDIKERLNMRTTSVSSEENLDGKLFVQFVALIYLSYIKKAMSDNDLFKSHTMQEVMDNLDIIERFEQPGKRHRIGEITKKQLHLYKCLGVEPPA
ncbi:IS1634 family transposase [Anaerotalea alkaliphila]|uniref:IS1634 family transposase n=1 Tax=Anaerotalea alkaliphila TaxID=2662126 RepID=A0A7X5HYJ2_9FIRM|nr:IS1634 family transposase [Anaerotalea alkaliphila]NDL68876.1 IS1634 family transposase [Anaerotalea alkaliphila]